MNRVGFMQGRLSPPVDGKIQAFPSNCWSDEFRIGHQLGFDCMEWTLDQERLRMNPLLTREGRSMIDQLSREYRIAINSVTADCFMQAPFWKADGANLARRIEDYQAVTESAAASGIRFVIVPLVDNGSLRSPEHLALFERVITQDCRRLRRIGIRLLIESDAVASDVASLIARFDRDIVGVNYDIGNSAALGYDVDEELAAYGDRIENVHVKDRQYGGSTVPLGEGAADFAKVFKGLRRHSYKGNFILQTARAVDGDHAGTAKRYADLTRSLLAAV